MDRYEHLDKAMCKELEKLDKKYTADVEMTEQELERADMLYHALKSAETYYAMKEADEMDEEESEGGYSGEGRSMRRTGRSYRRGSYNDGMSYARGRDMRTGRYISRDDGYSGHWNPMEYIDPMYWDRRY